MHAATKLGHPCARQRQGHDHPPLRVMTKAKPLPAVEIIAELFEYNQETGVFIRKTTWQNYKAGSEAGRLNRDGYRYICVKRRSYAAHRLAWLMVTKIDPAGFEIDHIDGDRQNNAFSNLRLATRHENNQNAKRRQDNSSGYKGVHFRKEMNKWRATIQVNKRQVRLGYFDTPELAHMAYAKAAAELHGEFARAA